MLADLYKQSVQEYTKTPAEWMGLLSCVARFYKRSFDNTVLIYAQRPDATQLATFDEWHDKRINRSINKGAKGIAVIDMANPNASIKYLFDFMDTNGTPGSFRNVMGFLWELEEQYQPSLLLKLHEKYNTPTASIEQCLYKLSQRMVREHLPPYLEDFKVRDESSMLYGMPIEAVKAELIQLITDSVAYTVFRKCGIDTAPIEDGAFENISHFNRLELFMTMGSCTVSLARPILKEINQQIKTIKIERSQIYENRATHEPQLSSGRGRDDVSRNPDFTESTDRPNAGGQIRQGVESLHDGAASPPPVRAGGTGQNQQHNPPSGRGSGTAERSLDSTASHHPADAGERGHVGESRSHEQPDEAGRGNRDERTGAEGQIIPQNSEHPEPPTDGHTPPVGGFFVVPPKNQQVPEVQDFSFEYQMLSRLQTDCKYFLGAGQRNEKHLWAGSIQAQISKMRELYDTVPEKPEWLTAQDIDRFEKEMAAMETDTSKLDTAIAPKFDLAVPMLDEEEISDLVDVVLCADDITPDTAEWLKELCDFFQGGHKQTTKANALKAFYGKLDADYITKTGEYLHLLSDTEGITFDTQGQQFAFTYRELAEKVDLLILQGAYPFSVEDSMLDDYAIPDEVEQMGGAADEVTEDADRYTEEYAEVQTLDAVDRGYLQTVLQDQSLSLYLQQTIQNYFAGEHDSELRTDFVRRTYGWGHREFEADGIQFYARTFDDGMHIKASSPIESVKIHCTWEQVTTNIETLIESNQYVNPNTSLPPSREEIINKILCKSGTYAGSKLRIYQAMLSFPAKKDHVTVLKNEHGIGGYSGGLENGGHESISSDGKGIKIEYSHDGVTVNEHFTWDAVESRIALLIREDAYLTDEEKAEMEAAGQTVYVDTPAIEDAPTSQQITMFDDFPSVEDTYEEIGGEDNDALLSEDSTEAETTPFLEGDRIYYQDHVYEILKFLHDDRTVEIGDVAQLQNLNGFKIRERVPLSAIADCKVLKDSYTEGEIANMVVNAAQSGDTTEETKDALKAALQVNQANDDYVKTIMQDFDSRTMSGGLNYHFSEEHHLYDGGAKTKCKNNIAAIRLLKELQAQGRIATAEEQITLAKFVGWGGLANALTPGKSGWESEYEEIKALLTEKEFQSAQESTLTAYYTEQEVIRHIYSALERFGFKGGNILDPAMGTGNFYSVLPASMSGSKLYGVELDTLSGTIAKQLYPEAEIQVKGFEQTNYPDQFFDVVIGNIPFNSIRVDDPRYNRHNFRIHDYFLAKSLDQVRPGGIVAVITSKYSMDKANSKVRRYLAQRAELLGAIRLPNNAFKAVAGTEVTTDILFLQKREREIVPDEGNSPWIAVENNDKGIPINTYFIDHPEMVLGEMVFDESMFGNEKTTACHPIPGDDLNERLERAVSYLEGEYRAATSEYAEEKGVLKDSLPADPVVRNYSYTVVDDAIYFQENSRMFLQDITGKKAERIRGMVEITYAVRALIDFQNQQSGDLPTAEYENELQEYIRKLNVTYDRFVKHYGYLNSYANVIAFSRDVNAPLLRSIEKERKEEKGIFDKSAMFYKATIKPKVMPKAVFSAEEALKVSLNVKGRVDLSYMAWLYQMPDSRKATPEEIIAELGDTIYQDPDEYTGNPLTGWQTAGEYLSGYVKDKLTAAILKAEEEPERFARNVDALKAVQPEPLTPQDISFSLGTPWIPLDVYQDFMYETFQTMNYYRTGRYAVELEFSKYNGAYFISNKGAERDSVMVNQTYGTDRMNAYEILETTLNQRFAEVKDRVEYVDENGEDKVKYVLNKKETILAREKQAQIKAEFDRWLFADQERGARLTKLYNDKFNNVRPREYDGSDLLFPDMSEGVHLRTHQRDVVAHGLYGDGNLLMAHEVGAGKTFAAIALAYELKRLGKVHKPLFAVPNHLVGQWADAYMELYPNANILVAEKRDFERKNRRRFAGRIAAGDYDAIIMAHSSFELIGLSRERQLAAMQSELDAVTSAISEQKCRDSKDWSLKQMQIFRKNLQYRYDHLFNADKKDDLINFEELGVDALIVDEAHAYKNNFSYTKMRNVAGISGTSSQRAMDMHQKCQYINEIGNGKGVIYLTGTPVSNTMAEMYVLQKTLQPQELERRDLLMFDAWAATFGKVVSSLEIRPEGNGYQMKNRFAQFHNLPELMSMFAMIADIKTADMLDLPTPQLKTGAVQVMKTSCTPEQKRIVMELAERAENIRAGAVDSSVDNFLKLTHEARLLSTDPRALDPTLPDDPDTKLNVCARKVAEIYHETAEERLTQLIFCDQGTPKYDGSFNFYEATEAELIAQGVKPEEIAFIHDAKTDVQREQLFEKIITGEIRVLMGSTEKMGTGMNVQKKLIALHHLDVPWRPSDLTQRNGRILRQGNDNKEISIFNYITENTFDAYLWQILEQKQRYISQIMTGRSALRTCEDLDETVLQYAEFKALATSDPRVKEKMEVDNEISRLTVLKSAWQSQRNSLLYNATKHYPEEIAKTTRRIANMDTDLAAYAEKKPEEFQMMIDGRLHEERTKAAEHLMVRARKLGRETGDTLDVGSYAGFSIRLLRAWGGGINIQLCGKCTYQADMGDSELGNITRIEKLAERITDLKQEEEQKLSSLNQQVAAAKEESEKPFSDEERLAELQKKKVSLDLALEFKEDGDDVMSADGSEEEVDGGENTGTSAEYLTLEQRIYQKLAVFAAPVLSGEAYYMKLKSDSFEDLSIEVIGGGEYSIAHYYEQNGDLMRDPEITFTVDKNKHSITPTSFLQDDMGIFYETANAAPAKVKDLKQFMSQWFTNIQSQGFESVKVKTYAQDDESEEMER